MKIDNLEIKGVIFDIDGTLIDSCGIWGEVDIRFFSKRNMEMPKDYQEAIGHIGLDKAAEYTIKRFNLNEKKEDIIKEWKNGVLELYANEVVLKPHVKEFLMLLKEHNIPFCAATANDEDCYKKCLERNGIYDLFDFILEVNHFKDGKDKPTIYLEAAKKLGVDISNCMVFEDLLMALNTASKAGFITCAVYEQTCKEEKEKLEIANFYIKDYQELIDKIN
ncbi:MAG: HAD family phosphatase [Bacilli bacterium]|nr:HAD family phosphatase [Bacilli bacterium]